jgi:uncharacterized repeat protein (TIGR02543 family)
MKRKSINKLIAGIILSTTVCTLVPSRASAEWVNDYQGNSYYMQDNEKMTGWKRIDGQLYYFDDSGKMQTGWIKAENSWYFLQNNGALKTGWINYNKNWYYADSNGAIQTGVINVSGKIYIFDDNGIMKTSNTVINGEFYTIGLDGEVVGTKVPTPDKEFDSSGKCVQDLKNTDNNVIVSPTSSKFDEVIEDQSQSDDNPNEGRTFKVEFKDSNGAELKSKTIKYGRSVDFYEPTKDGYNFTGWNTKSDGSGKSYDAEDSIKVKEDIILYAQWSDDTSVHVEGITIKGSSNVTINETVQMTAEVSPSDATNTNVTWSVINETGKATIDSNGVLTGVANGTITVKATAKDGSGVSGTKTVTVTATDVVVPVSQITVTSTTGLSKITANGGTLQMTASVLPADANNQNVAWSVENKTGSATISDTGLVTAVSNGTVTIKATAKDGSGVVGSTTITISGQSTLIPISSITVTGKNDADTIATDGGTLQMSASILPTTASNKLVTWSVEKVGDANTKMTGNATISSTGLLTAVADGTVTVKATAKDGTGIVGTKIVTISKQSIKVTGIDISGGTQINSPNGTLKMSAAISPADATKKDVTWSVQNKTGTATIDTDGTLHAVSNGTVEVTATAVDGSGVSKSVEITISGQTTTIPITGITVSGENNSSSITTDDGTLKMIATILPSNATVISNPPVTWSVISGTGTATIDADGTLHAISNGTVTVKATSKDKTSIYGTKTISLSGQIVQATGIAVSSAGDVTQLEVDGTLQMSATVSPTNATKKTVTWSVENGDGSATITSSGVLTGKSAGTVTVIATSTDGYEIIGIKQITIIPPVKVTNIGVKGAYIPDIGIGTTEITTDKGTIQMNATIGPTDATNKSVTWSVEQAGDAGTDMTGKATIDSNTGVLTAVADGTVRVKATAKDGSGIVGSEVITISNQVVKATGYTVKGFPIITGASETNQITTDKGTLQMKATVLPSNATTTPAVATWSVEQAGDTGTTMTGKAAIDSSTGVLTAAANGTVKVKAIGTTTDGTVITGTEVITISGQIVKVTGIQITTTTTTVNATKTLQMAASITPTTATNKDVQWEVTNIDGSATSSAVIDPSGLLTGLSAGTVKVTVTSKDDPTIFTYKYITIN